MTGFAHGAVLAHAEEIISLIKSGKVQHIFLVGGCDGAHPAEILHRVCQIHADGYAGSDALACGKYRFNDLDLGEIGGLPRILDMGQCNDAYSAIKVALALADGVRLHGQRPAAHARALVVRAEGGVHPADAACARREEYLPWTDAAGVSVGNRGSKHWWRPTICTRPPIRSRTWMRFWEGDKPASFLDATRRSLFPSRLLAAIGFSKRKRKENNEIYGIQRQSSGRKRVPLDACSGSFWRARLVPERETELYHLGDYSIGQCVQHDDMEKLLRAHISLRMWSAWTRQCTHGT